MRGEVGGWNIRRRAYYWFCDACGHTIHTERAASSRLPERAYRMLRELPSYSSLRQASREKDIPRSTISVWLWVARSHWEKVAAQLTERGCTEVELENIRLFAEETPERRSWSEGIKVKKGLGGR